MPSTNKILGIGCLLLSAILVFSVSPLAAFMLAVGGTWLAYICLNRGGFP